MKNFVKTIFAAALALGVITSTADARGGFGGGHFVPHAGGGFHGGYGFRHPGFRGGYYGYRRPVFGLGPRVGLGLGLGVLGYGLYNYGYPYANPCVWANASNYNCDYYGD